MESLAATLDLLHGTLDLHRLSAVTGRVHGRRVRPPFIVTRIATVIRPTQASRPDPIRALQSE